VRVGTDLSVYEQAKASARSAIRTRLLRVAGERLEAEGIEALSMRPLARAAGCSTMVFYTEFGSKDGLLDALADDRAARLLEAVETVADTDVVAHRRAVVVAFLDALDAMPEGYRVVVRAVAGDPAVRDRARARLFDLHRRLAAALLPGDDLLSITGLVLALRGAADDIVAGHGDRASLEPALLALVEAVSATA
jgi:AcrR family transcriptional regulator